MENCPKFFFYKEISPNVTQSLFDSMLLIFKRVSVAGDDVGGNNVRRRDCCIVSHLFVDGMRFGRPGWAVVILRSARVGVRI